VKLQALVRGYLVRKRMAQTIHQLQSVIRAQAVMTGLKHRSRQSRNRNDGNSVFSHNSFVIIFSNAMFLIFLFANTAHVIQIYASCLYKKWSIFQEKCTEHIDVFLCMYLNGLLLYDAFMYGTWTGLRFLFYFGKNRFKSSFFYFYLLILISILVW
jgi:hypothetical protein